jgi:hypothetical protein
MPGSFRLRLYPTGCARPEILSGGGPTIMILCINSTLLTCECVADELKPHFTNQSLHHDQGQGTPSVILTALTGEVSCGR